MDQKKAESDGNPDSVGDGGGGGEMLAALISSVVANASLMVQGQDSIKNDLASNSRCMCLRTVKKCDHNLSSQYVSVESGPAAIRCAVNECKSRLGEHCGGGGGGCIVVVVGRGRGCGPDDTADAARAACGEWGNRSVLLSSVCGTVLADATHFTNASS